MNNYIDWYNLTMYLITEVENLHNVCRDELLEEDYKYVANRAFHYWCLHQASRTLGIADDKIKDVCRKLFHSDKKESSEWLRIMFEAEYTLSI